MGEALHSAFRFHLPLGHTASTQSCPGYAHGTSLAREAGQVCSLIGVGLLGLSQGKGRAAGGGTEGSGDEGVLWAQPLCVVVCVPWGQPGRGPEQMPFLRLAFGPALLLLNRPLQHLPGPILALVPSPKHMGPGTLSSSVGEPSACRCGHLPPYSQGLMGPKPGHCAQLLEQMCLRSELPLLLASCLSQNMENPPSYKYTPYG